MRYDRQYLLSSKQVSFVKLDIARAVVAGAWLEPVRHPVLQDRVIEKLIFPPEEVRKLRLSEDPFEERETPAPVLHDRRLAFDAREFCGNPDRIFVRPQGIDEAHRKGLLPGEHPAVRKLNNGVVLEAPFLLDRRNKLTMDFIHECLKIGLVILGHFPERAPGILVSSALDRI